MDRFLQMQSSDLWVSEEKDARTLGDIFLTADGEGLTGLWFADRLPRKMPAFVQKGQGCGAEFLEEAKKWLDIYFSGRDPGFTPRLHLTGSEFRKQVCRIMLEIPYGKTMTYKEIAKRIEEERARAAGGTEHPRMSCQAVGGAVGHNPVSLIIPCHRVIGSDGSLTGYGGGLERKEALLRLEGIFLRKGD